VKVVVTMLDAINLLSDFRLIKNNYHIIFKYYIGGYENYPRIIDYLGGDIEFKDGVLTKEDEKKIYDYLFEHYGLPPFDRKTVKEKLKKYRYINLR